MTAAWNWDIDLENGKRDGSKHACECQPLNLDRVLSGHDEYNNKQNNG
jgi:hypothetical protein